MRAISLLGRDWPELGPLGLAELPDGGALALSRGAQPKAYPHKDPNEDAALLVRTDAGVLLAIADGFNGSEASELAHRARARARDGARRGARRRVSRAVVVRLATPCARRCRARRARARVWCSRALAASGSSSRASATRARGWSAPATRSPASTRWCSGRPLARARPDLWYGTIPRPSGERIALVSDGVTNFIAERDDPRRPGAAAERSRRRARARAGRARGGAGDNVAVAAFAGRAGV